MRHALFFLKDKTMARIPTRLVTVLDGTDRVMFINESDYDAEFHELMDGLPEPAAGTPATEPNFTVREGDDKFFVVNDDDQPTGNGFDTLEEAETLAKTLNDLTD